MDVLNIELILIVIGWLIFLGSSFFIYFNGRAAYKMVHGSVIGDLTKVLVFAVVVEMMVLGVVITAYLLSPIVLSLGDGQSFDLVISPEHVVIPILGIWSIALILVFRVLARTHRRLSELTQSTGTHGDKKE